MQDSSLDPVVFTCHISQSKQFFCLCYDLWAEIINAFNVYMYRQRNNFTHKEIKRKLYNRSVFYSQTSLKNCIFHKMRNNEKTINSIQWVMNTVWGSFISIKSVDAWKGREFWMRPCDWIFFSCFILTIRRKKKFNRT